MAEFEGKQVTYAVCDIDDDAVLAYVVKEFCPEDVFDGNDLAVWAEENGYTKEQGE